MCSGIQHLLQCIASGRAPILSADHAIHVLEVIEATREAARERSNEP